MDLYPVNLNLHGRKALVVGGGEVAARKVRDLLEAGAEIAVASPELCAELTALRDTGAVSHVRRGFEAGDLADCFLAIAATDNRAVNAAVSRAALAAKVLVNVVDNAELSSFTVPAKLRRGALLLTASTGGASPALSRQIRLRLAALFGEEYAAYIDFLGKLRPAIQGEVVDPLARAEVLEALADFDLVELFARDREGLKRRIRQILPATTIRHLEELLG